MVVDLSVVVTVYNKCDYIHECLNSILSQTLKNIEIICVDDGSIDGSAAILDDFKKKYNNIKVIHQENKGQIPSKKIGCQMAQGEYITFVDGDDWIETDMYRLLIERLKKNSVDLISSGEYKRGSEKIKKFDYLQEGVYVQEDVDLIMNGLIYQSDIALPLIIPHAVTKIYKSDILKKILNNIDERIRYQEDNAIVWSYLLNCNSVEIVHEAYYHVRDAGISHSRQRDPLFLARENYFYNYMKKTIENSKYAEKLKWQLDKCFVNTISLGINYFMGIDVSSHYMPNYVYDRFENNDKIVIYGSGEIGRRIAEQFIDCSYKGNLVAILDRKAGIYLCGLYSITLEEFLESGIEYDHIIIANANASVREEIFANLLDKKIDAKKILKDIPIYI